MVQNARMESRRRTFVRREVTVVHNQRHKLKKHTATLCAFLFVIKKTFLLLMVCAVFYRTSSKVFTWSCVIGFQPTSRENSATKVMGIYENMKNGNVNVYKIFL